MADCPHQMCKDKAKCDLWPELPPGSEFPQPGSDINWAWIHELEQRPHPQLKDDIPLPDELWAVGEVLTEAKAVHHLLDSAGVPRRYSLDTGDIASRTLIAVTGMRALRERLDWISGLHQREPGMAAGNCSECGRPWPCVTRQMADGTYADPDDDPEPEPAPGRPGHG